MLYFRTQLCHEIMPTFVTVLKASVWAMQRAILRLVLSILEYVIRYESGAQFVRHTEADVTLVEGSMLLTQTYQLSTHTTNFNSMCVRELLFVFPFSDPQRQHQDPIIGHAPKNR